MWLFDRFGASSFASALRANTSLSTLKLSGVGLWHDRDSGGVIVDALRSHPSLQKISLSWNRVAHRNLAAVNASLALLVSSNTPHLSELSISFCKLGDGIRPILDALAANTHLRVLRCKSMMFTAAFAANVVSLVRQNQGLRKLTMAGGGTSFCELIDAEALVAARQ